jgi:hypothetical protein
LKFRRKAWQKAWAAVALGRLGGLKNGKARREAEGQTLSKKKTAFGYSIYALKMLR